MVSDRDGRAMIEVQDVVLSTTGAAGLRGAHINPRRTAEVAELVLRQPLP